MSLYAYYIFGHAQLFMNDYLASNSFSVQGKIFIVSLLFSEDNRQDKQDYPYGLSYNGKFL